MESRSLLLNIYIHASQLLSQSNNSNNILIIKIEFNYFKERAAVLFVTVIIEMF